MDYYYEKSQDYESDVTLRIEDMMVIDSTENNQADESYDYDSSQEVSFQQADDHCYTSRLRRSMSATDITVLKNLRLDSESPKETTVPNTNLTHNFISMENIDRLSQPKYSFLSQYDMKRDHYVPLAEAILSFPDFLHLRPSMYNDSKTTTVPHSPCLISVKRTRPVSALTREEEERLKFEEAQKNKFKAHPLDRKIFKQPKLPTAQNEKKHTIPEPFHLTETKPKLLVQKVETPIFHAKPVPDFNKTINSMKISSKKALTNPRTPTFMKNYQPRITKVDKKEEHKPKRTDNKTQAVPFSFEKRNQLLAKKKEEFVKKILEEEKKAREFHAKPVPKGLLKPSNMSSTSSESCRTLDGTLPPTPTFRAQPPKVLKMKPFKPKKADKPLTVAQGFDLHTDRRAKAWEDFQGELEERNQLVETYKQMMEERKRQLEEEEVKRLRKMTEHKAQPIRKYKPVEIQYSGMVTEPMSPNFTFCNSRRVSKAASNDNKENK